MGELVTESGNNGVIIRVPEGTEDVGYYEAGELGIVIECPLFEEFPSFFFRFSIEVVAFFLGGGGEKDVGCRLRIFTSLDELLNEADVGVVDDFGVVVAVHGGEVDDGVAGFYKRL